MPSVGASFDELNPIGSAWLVQVIAANSARDRLSPSPLSADETIQAAIGGMADDAWVSPSTRRRCGISQQDIQDGER